MPDGHHGLSHGVYFTLKDRSPAACAALVSACNKHLPEHEGLVHMSVGIRGEQYQRPVNDQDFDVALTLVFATEADHERYQVSARHKQFIAENAPTWAKVRVFDALIG
ncbi:MAG: Dabb family protein [Pirellulales bacterium]|nr:Dabb family protein [Pirellulales bacterium]